MIEDGLDSIAVALGRMKAARVEEIRFSTMKIAKYEGLDLSPLDCPTSGLLGHSMSSSLYG